MHKSERPEIPCCKERIDFNFIKYVITYNKKKRPELVDTFNTISKEKILIFKNQKSLNNWLKHFTNNENILKNNL